MLDPGEIRPNKSKTVAVLYENHKLTGRILSAGERVVTFKIDQPGCRAMILDREKIRLTEK